MGKEAESEIWMESEEGEGGFKGNESEGDSDRAYRVRAREESQRREGEEAADGRREEKRH